MTNDPQGSSSVSLFAHHGEADPPNPEVIVYRDPVMAHTGFTAPAAPRYFDAADVWDFFKAHPRVML